MAPIVVGTATWTVSPAENKLFLVSGGEGTFLILRCCLIGFVFSFSMTCV